ncbi:MAG: putative bifunctional diguanylate cyclase/phosphodiesterase [Nitrospiria bacterium]
MDPQTQYSKNNHGNLEDRYRALFEWSEDIVLVVDPQTGRLFDFNNNANTRLGYTRRVFAKMRVGDFVIMQPEDNVAKRLETLRAKGSDRFQMRFRTQSGAVREVYVGSKTIVLEGKDYLRWHCREISRGTLSETFKHLSTAIFNASSEAILITNSEKKIISVNPAFTKITGYAAEEVLGKNPKILQSGRHDQGFYKEMWKRINALGHWQGEIWNRRKNGETYPEWLSITAVEDEENHVVQYTAVFSDITQRKAGETKLKLQAYYDPLTKLPNRILLLERLSQAIKQTRRKKCKAALLFVDLDRFKQVNDTLGHQFGDGILKMSAEKLVASVRETDTVARAGGDEFLIVLTEIKGREEASMVAKEILARFSDPFEMEGHHISLGASIGISIVPDDSMEGLVLIDKADMAMYQSKTSGRNSHHFFSHKMNKTAKDRTDLGWDLKDALEKGELVIHYQPIVDLVSLETVLLEAMVCWRHPEKGLLFPDRFIALAENAQTIGNIGEWLIQGACNQVIEWRQRFGIRPSLSIDVSGFQINHKNFGAVLSALFDKAGFAPACLTLEVPEKTMIDPSEDIVSKISELKDMGIRLAVDRFGTGYASLSCLSRHPIDLVKIDPSLTRRVVTDRSVQHLVKAIIGIGRHMELDVVADGVETPEAISYLTWLSCHAAQGSYFTRPLPAKEYQRVFLEHKDMTSSTK